MARTIDVGELKKSLLYSEDLGIALWGNDDGELFKWFLASLLFGARISATIARRTYCTFEAHRLLRPQAIPQAGWDFLANPLMREGGYVRFDGITATKVLKGCTTLMEQYRGSLQELRRQARENLDLERRLTAFHGVGPVTANIFLLELRPVWEKADPKPLPTVRETAAKFGVDLTGFDRKREEFIRIEAGLIRLRKQPAG